MFASADTRQMDAARGPPGWSSPPVPFATNAPVIVVPADNPGKVHTLADLANVQRLVIGAPEVPIGAYTLQILERARAKLGDDFPARVEARVVSRELNVRQVLDQGDARRGRRRHRLPDAMPGARETGCASSRFPPR